MADERYWTYRASTPTPSHDEAVQAGAFKGTAEQWHQLSPGMRREVMRTARKQAGLSECN